jgi:hypothetical protein
MEFRKSDKAAEEDSIDATRLHAVNNALKRLSFAHRENTTPQQETIMSDQCPLCERRRAPSSEFCNLHNVALNNLENAYMVWNRGHGGNLNKSEYFTKIEKLDETGNAVKDIIKHLRGKGAVK